jgi:hypothetical protein
MKKTYEIFISAIVEFDDEEFEVSDLESSAVVCFMKHNTYDDTELFLPEMGSMRVVEYTETHTIEVEGEEGE